MTDQTRRWHTAIAALEAIRDGLPIDTRRTPQAADTAAAEPDEYIIGLVLDLSCQYEVEGQSEQLKADAIKLLYRAEPEPA